MQTGPQGFQGWLFYIFCNIFSDVFKSGVSPQQSKSPSQSLGSVAAKKKKKNTWFTCLDHRPQQQLGRASDSHWGWKSSWHNFSPCLKNNVKNEQFLEKTDEIQTFALSHLVHTIHAKVKLQHHKIIKNFFLF